ncbi:hypothetical protein [Corynebacterium appendicis]|uniref:hypothetical protein n=1 Tax=Corynebacterium appendicis TaxID=163202 RepID=UPI00254E9E53|nr:hypothetical protein [Corynebacterium appendicis]MDK8626589.1 hypothetical protein [Corynebacterium appendicis]
MCRCVFFVVDGDAGEQGAVEDASFGWFALVIELVEVDQEFGELVQACSGLGVGVGEVVERPPEGETTVNTGTPARPASRVRRMLSRPSTTTTPEAAAVGSPRFASGGVGASRCPAVGQP